MQNVKLIVWITILAVGIFFLSGCISRPSHHMPHGPRHLQNDKNIKNFEMTCTDLTVNNKIY